MTATTSPPPALGPTGDSPNRPDPAPLSLIAAHDPPTVLLAGLRFNPAARVLWRSPGRLQLEVGDDAVVVDGLPPVIIDGLRGRARSEPDLPAAAISSETGDDDVLRDPDIPGVLNTLHRRRFLTLADSLDTAHPGAGNNASLSGRTRGLLAPDLAALSERYGDQAAHVLAARRAKRVLVRGEGRLPAAVAALLGSAGVGHVHVTGPPRGGVRLSDALPGGIQPADEGRRAIEAGTDAVRRAGPDVDTSTLREADADLIVINSNAPLLASGLAVLTAAERPHLISAVWGAGAVIGPLVVPGRTSCLRCCDRHRSDRDPAWPALAAQLAVENLPHEPSDISLSALASAVTSIQALAFLDGEASACENATLEMRLPDWRVRRRSWPPHPDCGCLDLDGPPR